MLEQNQRFENLKWGTGMPITIMVGMDVMEVRTRGMLTVLVEDPKKANDAFPGAENIELFIKSMTIQSATEAIGEVSQAVSSFEQLKGKLAEVQELFSKKLMSTLGQIGLQVEEITVETIEKA